MMIRFSIWNPEEPIEEVVFLPNNYTEAQIEEARTKWLIETIEPFTENIDATKYSVRNLFRMLDCFSTDRYKHLEYGETKNYYYWMLQHLKGYCAIHLIRKDLEGTESLYFKTREDAENWITKESEEV